MLNKLIKKEEFTMLNKSSKSYLSRVIGLLLVAVILMQTTLISYAQGDSEASWIQSRKNS